MGWQDVAALGSVALALTFLAYKFVAEPRLRSRRPHVPVSALVRRAKNVKPEHPGGCH